MAIIYCTITVVMIIFSIVEPWDNTHVNFKGVYGSLIVSFVLNKEINVSQDAVPGGKEKIINHG